MAEGFARHLGEGVISAASAGLKPTPTVSEDTVATMAEAGIDIRAHFPKQFDYRRADAHDVIVNMSGFDLPPTETAIVTEWDIRDPFYEDAGFFREVRNEIEQRVRDLIEDIRRNGTLTGDRVASYSSKKPRLWQRLTSRR